MIKVILLGLLGACSHIIKDKIVIEVIPVVGNPREVKTVQNKLKRDGCYFLKKISAHPGEGNGTMDDLMSEGLIREAHSIGAHVVVSNLKPQEKTNEVHGLAYKCPHLDEEDEE